MIHSKVPNNSQSSKETVLISRSLLQFSFNSFNLSRVECCHRNKKNIYLITFQQQRRDVYHIKELHDKHIIESYFEVFRFLTIFQAIFCISVLATSLQPVTIIIYIRPCKYLISTHHSKGSKDKSRHTNDSVGNLQAASSHAQGRCPYEERVISSVA